MPPVKRKSGGFATAAETLLLTEGLAVRALIHSGIGFVGADQDSLQRAVILGVAVVCALLDGALDALVGMIIHGFDLLLKSSKLV